MSIPIRNNNGKGIFYYLYDHCFSLKGQGTVLTGTIIEGCIQYIFIIYYYIFINSNKSR